MYSRLSGNVEAELLGHRLHSIRLALSESTSTESCQCRDCQRRHEKSPLERGEDNICLCDRANVSIAGYGSTQQCSDSDPASEPEDCSQSFNAQKQEWVRERSRWQFRKRGGKQEEERENGPEGGEYQKAE